MHSVPSRTSSCYANPSPSEPPFVEHDTSSPSTDLHIVIGGPTLDTHTATYHIGDTFYSVYYLPKAAESSKYCYANAQAVDPPYADHIPLTRQALQHHNTKNKLPHTNDTTQHSHLQGHAYTSISRDAARHTLSTTQYESVEVEPCFYPRQHHQLHMPTAIRREHEQCVDTDLVDHSIYHQAPYPYPIYIQQSDLTANPGHLPDHQTEGLESCCNHPPSYQALNKAPTSSNYALTEVGAQFS